MIKGIAKYPGKLWEAGKYPANVSCTFTLGNGDEVKVNEKKIDSAAAAFIQTIMSGDVIPLNREKNGLHGSPKTPNAPEFFYKIDFAEVAIDLQRQLEELR